MERERMNPLVTLQVPGGIDDPGRSMQRPAAIGVADGHGQAVVLRKVCKERSSCRTAQYLRGSVAGIGEGVKLLGTATWSKLRSLARFGNYEEASRQCFAR
ncbi:hypothetical protein GQ55_7G023300 [Panicum hallii var. hallii]|uniref:Uncharacterized protein n=1 Tax=Panicum hallii var. hallii TaxID=1504633 RepID=A0A2T7CS13_9POAL|nr:hypothetical protein GQ55_7G023300 [Panicum hallii var. hallii]